MRRCRCCTAGLPRKVLREVCGVPLVVRVYRSAQRAPALSDLVVATDSAEVLDVCRVHGVNGMLTSPDHASGTDPYFSSSKG